MQNRFRLILLDLDGTTVASHADALPSQRVIDTVKKAQDKVLVALATGRPVNLARPVIDALNLHGPSIFNGGAEIIDLTTNKMLFRQLLSIDQLQELVKLALPFGYKIYTDEDQYGTEITSPNDIHAAAVKLFIEAVATKSLAAILEELSAVAGAAPHPTSSWTPGDVYDIHITHEHATKRYGVEKLMKHLGFSKQEVLAIGDGHNDIPLLEAAGTKVAMANGPKEVRLLADFVTASLENDGVAVAIEKYILP